jgi:hypothetical protein
MFTKKKRVSRTKIVAKLLHWWGHLISTMWIHAQGGNGDARARFRCTNPACSFMASTLPARVASSRVSTAAGRSWAPGDHVMSDAIRDSGLWGWCRICWDIVMLTSYIESGCSRMMNGGHYFLALRTEWHTYYVIEVHTNYLRHKTLANVGQLLEKMYLFLGKANMYLYLSIYSIHTINKRAKEVSLSS